MLPPPKSSQRKKGSNGSPVPNREGGEGRYERAVKPAVSPEHALIASSSEPNSHRVKDPKPLTSMTPIPTAQAQTSASQQLQRAPTTRLVRSGTGSVLAIGAPLEKGKGENKVEKMEENVGLRQPLSGHDTGSDEFVVDSNDLAFTSRSAKISATLGEEFDGRSTTSEDVVWDEEDAIGTSQATTAYDEEEETDGCPDGIASRDEMTLICLGMFEIPAESPLAIEDFALRMLFMLGLVVALIGLIVMILQGHVENLFIYEDKPPRFTLALFQPTINIVTRVAWQL